MKFKKEKLMLDQLDRKLIPLKNLPGLKRPSRGWIHTIRKTLRISAKRLGEKLGVSQPRITRLEEDEKLGKVTLKTMAKVADALDCQFTYAFVPKQSLKATIDQKIHQAALKKLKHIHQSMALENQSITQTEFKKSLRAIEEELHRTLPSSIWNEN